MAWVARFGDQIRYSQAFAPEAGSARAWQTPRDIGIDGEDVRYVDLALGPDGSVHIVYAVLLGERSGVYHALSADGGQSWSRPDPVYANPPFGRMLDRARVAVDAAGGIHVTWTEYGYPETFPPLGIRYARSVDGGQTWSEPYDFDGPYDLGGILAVGADEIHVVWSGTEESRHKLHTYSLDRGETWMPLRRTLERGGFEGWPALATDGADAIHLLQVADTQSPEEAHIPLYHHVWNGSDWSTPSVLLATQESAPNHLYDPDVVVGLGNQIHVVASNMIESPPGSGRWSYDIFYLRGLAAAPSSEPEALSGPKVTHTVADRSRPEPTRVEAVAGSPTAGAVRSSSGIPVAVDQGVTVGVIAGVIPALVLVIGVVVVLQLRRR